MKAEFNFGPKIVAESEPFLYKGKRVIEAVNIAIGERRQLDLNSYALAVANAIDVTLGHRSKIGESSFLVAEAIAIGMAGNARGKGFLGPLMETQLRLKIREEMSRLETEESR